MGVRTTEKKGSPPRDCIVVEGINAHGFGTVPKAVMRDVGLPVEAKGIYAYLCSFAGGGQTAFPSRATMLAELGLSKDRFYKYRAMLVERGLLRIERRSEGKVAHPVRTNVYILSTEMPECYQARQYRRLKAASPAAAKAAASAQVGNDVLETGTPSGSFPQSAAQERCPENKDVVGSGTTKRPENQDATEAEPPSSDGGKSGPIKNRVINNNNPTVQLIPLQEDIEREFEALSSPERTPNRNRIHDALALYGEARKRFPASVIGAAWDRRQHDAWETERPAHFFPQLARWFEDPGHDGAERMCEAEAERAEKRRATMLSVALSLDEGYMAMRAEASQLSKIVGDGDADSPAATRLAALEEAMAAVRESKSLELEAIAP